MRFRCCLLPPSPFSRRSFHQRQRLFYPGGLAYLPPPPHPEAAPAARVPVLLSHSSTDAADSELRSAIDKIGKPDGPAVMGHRPVWPAVMGPKPVATATAVRRAARSLAARGHVVATLVDPKVLTADLAAWLSNAFNGTAAAAPLASPGIPPVSSLPIALLAQQPLLVQTPANARPQGPHLDNDPREWREQEGAVLCDASGQPAWADISELRAAQVLW